MLGSCSSSPRISASSASVTSTSRTCSPGWSPACPSPPSPGSPAPCPTPCFLLSPKRKCGSSIPGSGIEIRSFPLRPNISPCETNLRRSDLILPRTMSRKRLRSRSMRRITGDSRLLGVAAREDARHEVEHVGGADVAVAVVLDQARLDDVDLLLRVLVDHRGDEAGQLDRVLLVLEELELERLLQALVAAPGEGLPLHRQRADVVHDLAPEVVLARVGDADLLLDRAHQPLVGLLVTAGVLVPDLLALRVGLQVVEVVA